MGGLELRTLLSMQTLHSGYPSFYYTEKNNTSSSLLAQTVQQGYLWGDIKGITLTVALGA